MDVPASILDDPATYALDREGMFEHIRSLGSQFVAAWEASHQVSLPAQLGRATAVVIAGIGGSATAGDYFAAIAAATAPIPVVVVQGFDLPAFAGPRSLVVACSYSGNTAETLAAYGAAVARGARVVAITGGGALASHAAASDVPLFPIGYRASPRATTVHTLAPLLRIGEMLGLVTGAGDQVARAAAAHRELVASELDPAVPRRSNRAKEIAHNLAGRVPIVLGAGHLQSAAVRFKNQLAENGKTLAAADAVPQSGHNLVVGLASAAGRAGTFAVVSLEPRGATYLGPRLDAICAEFEAAGIHVDRVSFGGRSILEDLLVATAWGDYVSCYMALLNGVDPTPTPQIDRIRNYGS
jgi:glucose/mannose-6-phosphate isomerase